MNDRALPSLYGILTLAEGGLEGYEMPDEVEIYDEDIDEE